MTARRAFAAGMLRAGLVVSLALALGCSRPAPAGGPPVARAFYFWRTTFALSAEETRAISELHVARLYVRVFDVAWNEAEHRATPLGPIVVPPGARPPAGVEVVPVVFLREEVLRHVAAAQLAGELWAEVSRRAAALGSTPRELQLDCDWTVHTRDAYCAPHERELGRAMTTLDQSYQRTETVRTEVRDQLAKLYLAANKLVDAEYLHPGSVDSSDAWSVYWPRPGKLHWAEVGFIKDMLARRAQTATDFDSFVLSQDVLTEPKLQQELALRYALDGDFAAAKQIFETTSAEREHLEVDPFVTHIKDCRECDEQKYAHTTWTHASVIAKLAGLAARAQGTGEDAAEASIQIGNALYNFTSFGNARRVLRETHQDTYDARPAERWYKRAYELTKNKEQKAKAAYLAAKAERANRVDTAAPDDATSDTNDTNDTNDTRGGLPIPKMWFAKLKELSSTRYYKEVLKECSTFRTWSGK